MQLIQRIDTSQPGADKAIETFRAKLALDSGHAVSAAGRVKTIELFGEPLTPAQVVARICDDVRRRGIDAVLEYTAKLDGAQLTAGSLLVPEEELVAAHAAVDGEFLEVVKRIRHRILKFQRAILHTDTVVPLDDGGSLTQRYVPIRRVGICIPGGAAAYPSSLLMTVVPACAAGVSEIVVVAPPTKFGSYNQHLLAACFELGVSEVYRMGGAQAIAALAYGAEGIPRVDKIVGPGNLFVALAKRYVFGEVDIDSIAGPSEVIVIADETTRADYVAADLLAQAEHSPGSSVLISWHKPLVDEVERELEKQLAKLTRSELTKTALAEFGALITVDGRDEAAKLADLLATEHLHIACRNPREMLEHIGHAGAVFIGPHSPVAIGDYTAGPSHVLPTGATARFASGLSSNDFLRSHSVIELAAQDLATVADDAIALADVEGLTAHAASVLIRSR